MRLNKLCCNQDIIYDFHAELKEPVAKVKCQFADFRLKDERQTKRLHTCAYIHTPCLCLHFRLALKQQVLVLTVQVRKFNYKCKYK